ncbi:MAG: hypothetical protein WAU45_01280 [Blastocatellia bacterium]
MRIQRRVINSLICALALVSNGAGVGAAQEKAAQDPKDVVIEHVVVGAGHGWQEEGQRAPFNIMVPPGRGDTFMFVSSEMSLNGKTVKGAPYSAQAISEHTQTLQDGNRIVHKSTASVFRDSEGRTRREQTINAVGAYTSGGTPRQTLFINDPVANVNYILEPDTRTARRIDLSQLLERRPFGAARAGGRGQRVEIAGEPGRRVEIVTADKVPVEIVTADKVPGGSGESVVIARSSTKAEVEAKVRGEADAKNVKTESLGKQTIEGVAADGTRSIRTIPAGEIGNEQPINIVSESWYSAELQTVVMSRHSDPRFGESSYRLTNINRSEPAASLFQVPSDYSVKETMPRDMQFKIEREMRRPKNDQ